MKNYVKAPARWALHVGRAKVAAKWLTFKVANDKRRYKFRYGIFPVITAAPVDCATILGLCRYLCPDYRLASSIGAISRPIALSAIYMQVQVEEGGETDCQTVPETETELSWLAGCGSNMWHANWAQGASVIHWAAACKLSLEAKSSWSLNLNGFDATTDTDATEYP